MPLPSAPLSRRQFLATAAAGALSVRALAESVATPAPAIPIVDIHQHTPFTGRTDTELIAHQRANGIRKTILLPAGRANKLAAGVEPVAHTYDFIQQHPGGEFAFFANDDIDAPGAVSEIARYLDKGAIGIGELKDKVKCDSEHVVHVAELARDRGVPVIMHFQDGTYNDGFANFHRIIEKFPTVKFIAHAQTFWCYVDKNYVAAHGLYPKTKITPGGLSDRWLADYPNFYGDLSAGSGTNALLRQPEFGKAFIERHQDKLLFGSDCSCKTGRGPTCFSVEKFGMWRDMGITDSIMRKILFANAQTMFRFPDLA